MRIGILADIHEHVENLRAALALFQSQDVRQLVILGDVFETGRRIDETIELLSRHNNRLGVWGNHELGLCVDPSPSLSAKYGERVLDFFRAFQPSIEIEGARFSHGMPTWNALTAEDFYLGDPPWSGESLAATYSTFANSAFFIGHFHRWQAWAGRRKLEWNGTRPLVLDRSERYLIVVHGVRNGWCAILDTEANRFTPVPIGPNTMSANQTDV